MKAFLGILLTVLVVSQIGNTVAEASLKEKIVARKLDRNQNNALRCIRKIAERRHGGLESPHYTAQLLTKYSAGKNDINSLKNIQKKCEFLIKSLPKNRYVTIEELRIRLLEISNPDSYSSEVFLSTDAMVIPKYSCRTAQLEGSVALGFSLAVGFGGGTCRGNNGRKFAVLSSTLGVGLGVGAALIVGVDEFNHQRTGYGAQGNMDGQVVGAMGFAVRRGLRQFSPVNGVGLGFGVLGYAQISGKLNILPLGTDWKKVKARL